MKINQWTHISDAGTRTILATPYPPLERLYRILPDAYNSFRDSGVTVTEQVEVATNRNWHEMLEIQYPNCRKRWEIMADGTYRLVDLDPEDGHILAWIFCPEPNPTFIYEGGCVVDHDYDPARIAVVGNSQVSPYEDYGKAAMRYWQGGFIGDPFRVDETVNMPMLINAVMGLSGEAGEVDEPVKKYLFQGHEIDMVHLKKELGDVTWYLNLAAKAINLTLEDLMAANLEKLHARYPDDKFDIEKSLHRKKGDI